MFSLLFLFSLLHPTTSLSKIVQTFQVKRKQKLYVFLSKTCNLLGVTQVLRSHRQIQGGCGILPAAP